jgi:hypothetical protein
MIPVGYAHLVDALGLRVRPPRQPASIDTSVNRRVTTKDRILFPSSVALTDTPIGHLEFALRHEGVDLGILAAALPAIGPHALVERLCENPNGEYIRRAAFLWEWLTGDELGCERQPTGRYINLFDPDRYYTAPNPVRHPRYRVQDNALGDRRFCPVLSRSVYPGQDWLPSMMLKATEWTEGYRTGGVYERAIQYLYLSETKSSFAIERETPSVDREERFVQILRRAGETGEIDEQRLVEIQNAAVRDPFSREAGYRQRQNWLEDASGRISFLPHPPEQLRETMMGWEAFVNDEKRGIDPLVKAAGASFGLVYLHPFMDGNGRLHRFIAHHVLTHSGLVPSDMVIPVSAVIMKHIPAYLAVLEAFSRPITSLWDYLRLDDGPFVREGPGPSPYRYFTIDAELTFLQEMIRQAVEQEIPAELAWLTGFDQASRLIDARFDLPQKDIARLIRMIRGNGGRLAKRKRTQFDWIPDEVITEVESMVCDAFDLDRESEPSGAVIASSRRESRD